LFEVAEKAGLVGALRRLVAALTGEAES
jgi:hypothetical protein